MSKPSPGWREDEMGRFEIEAKTFDGYTEVWLVCSDKMANVIKGTFYCGEAMHYGIIRQNPDGTTEYRFRITDHEDQRHLVDWIGSFPSHYDIPMN